MCTATFQSGLFTIQKMLMNLDCLFSVVDTSVDLLLTVQNQNPLMVFHVYGPQYRVENQYHYFVKVMPR